MKKKMKYLLLAGGLMFAISCGNKQKEADDATEVDVNIKDTDTDGEMDADYTIIREEYDQRIQENKDRIRELREAKRDGKQEVDAAYEAKIDELEQRNEEMRNRLSQYEKTDRTGWERFKEEFRHDMDELGEAIGDLFENNKK
jgi:hypothetical protein